MPQEKFKLENIHLLENGVIAATFDSQLKRLVRDCDERPLDDKPRELTLKFRITPKPDTHGAHVVCDEVAIECEVSGKVPVERSKIYSMKPKQDGSLMFHPDLPDSPDDETIMDEADRRRNARQAS